MRTANLLRLALPGLCATVVACSASPEAEPVVEVDMGETMEPDVAATDEPDTGSEEPMEEPRGMPAVWGVQTLEDINPDETIVEVNLTAEPTLLDVGEDLQLEMWTYNGMVPGPLIEANVGDTVVVNFTNNLEEATTVHWHGLRISDEMDGNPRIQNPVPPGGTFRYEYVVEDAGTYWYHPHLRTFEQIERGLYGALVVHEADRPALDLERWIVADDILLDGDNFARWMGSHMELMHGRYGNVFMTNGSIAPFSAEAKVGHVERWRFVNPANARTMIVQLQGGSMTVVGTDGGRVEPFEVTKLEIPVGQRFDVEVRYAQAGKAVLNQLIPFQTATGAIANRAYEIGSIEVTEDAELEPFEFEWGPAPELPQRSIDREETIVLDAVEGGEYGIQWRLNGQSHAMDPLFTFQQGDTVKIVLDNQLGPEHPFHLHGNFFTIDDPDQPGLKDTVLVPGVSRVSITAYMDNPGQWMLHCHINEHAELGMMAEYEVLP